ncbi:tetratricopeptide repeat protein [Stigmatella aurantiaca]|uniref:Tetratricopeptide repeat protein n=1 Tax=Stigmatella aurantiaca (strain DW4/3-1) TaxID=378806 RepID=Q08UB7_STIAD|nr:tetratricopeptide repeat protein [Stigmatella aurantiaca]ADO69130.1 uncharacterized protein STAUR_1326 [Stigmatella aurantiaca DW4/3-1]EAU64068.1 hypothetical protein STIAU_0046 [Stigmatella aurantiaca DW4/3-1]
MRSVLVLVLLVTTPALAQALDSDWKAGLAFYRAKNYARACPLLLKAAEAASTHGAIWADLGLCELKRGKKAESIRASNLAVRYGDEKIRESAYFNLGLVGVNLAPQGVVSDGTCVPIEPPKELACAQRITGCGHTIQLPGYTYREEQRAGLLIVHCDDGTCPAQSPFGGHCVIQRDDSCPEPSIVLVSGETSRGPGATPEWTCEASGAVELRAQECQSKKGADAKMCARKACKAAIRWRKEAPASRAEWKELHEELEGWASINECKACAEFTRKTQCTVVSIDPCSGRAGTVCTLQETTRDVGLEESASANAQSKTLVQEQSFQAAPAPKPVGGK